MINADSRYNAYHNSGAYMMECDWVEELRKYADMLKERFKNMNVPEHDIDILMVDVQMRIHNRPPRDGYLSLQYVKQAANWALQDYWRRVGRDNSRLVDVLPPDDDDAGDGDAQARFLESIPDPRTPSSDDLLTLLPVHTFCQKFNEVVLPKFLESCSHRDLEIFFAHLHRKSLETIAEEMRLKCETVKKYLNRARQVLISVLQASGICEELQAALGETAPIDWDNIKRNMDDLWALIGELLLKIRR